MSEFAKAIPVIMQHEGGYVDDPDDLGGPTMMGWSMLTIKRLGFKPRDLGIDQDDFTPGCLKAMKASMAIALYERHFWNKYEYGSINDQTAATKVFDSAVNMGPSRAAQFAQNAANKLIDAKLAVDGKLGPKSFEAINKCDPVAFVKAFADEMTAYYLKIIEQRPANAKFKNNWLRRAQWGVAK